MKYTVAADFDNNEKETIKRIILERHKKYNPETEEEKDKIMRKVLDQYADARRRKNHRLDIDLPIASDIKIYIANNIR